MKMLEKYVVYYDTHKQTSVISRKQGYFNGWKRFVTSLGIHHQECVFDTMEDAIKYCRRANYIVEV